MTCVILHKLPEVVSGDSSLRDDEATVNTRTYSCRSRKPKRMCSAVNPGPAPAGKPKSRPSQEENTTVVRSANAKESGTEQGTDQKPQSLSAGSKVKTIASLNKRKRVSEKPTVSETIIKTSSKILAKQNDDLSDTACQRKQSNSPESSVIQVIDSSESDDPLNIPKQCNRRKKRRSSSVDTEWVNSETESDSDESDDLQNNSKVSSKLCKQGNEASKCKSKPSSSDLAVVKDTRSLSGIQLSHKRNVRRASSVEWNWSGSESAGPSKVPQSKKQRIFNKKNRARSVDSDSDGIETDAGSDRKCGRKSRSKGPNMCHICGDKFKKPSLLRIHLHQHINKATFICDEKGCSKAYFRKQHLDRHKSRSHSDFVFVASNIQCPSEGCLRLFASAGGLKRHINAAHSGNGLKYPCPQCDKQFRKHKQLRYHLAEHSGEPPLRCDVCQEGAYSDKQLKFHKRTHKKYPCNIPGCDQILSNFPSFRKHVAEHNRCFQTLSCAHCGLQLKTKAQLRTHVMTHLEDRPVFKCTFESCPRFFYYERNLRSHIRVRHERKSKFTCTWTDCNMVFYNQRSLTKHLRVHENGKMPIQKRKEGPRAVRKDSGKPKRAIAPKLAGLVVPFQDEKVLLKTNLPSKDDDIEICDDVTDIDGSESTRKAKEIFEEAVKRDRAKLLEEELDWSVTISEQGKVSQANTTPHKTTLTQKTLEGDSGEGSRIACLHEIQHQKSMEVVHIRSQDGCGGGGDENTLPIEENDPSIEASGWKVYEVGEDGILFEVTSSNLTLNDTSLQESIMRSIESRNEAEQVAGENVLKELKTCVTRKTDVFYEPESGSKSIERSSNTLLSDSPVRDMVASEQVVSAMLCAETIVEGPPPEEGVEILLVIPNPQLSQKPSVACGSNNTDSTVSIRKGSSSTSEGLAIETSNYSMFDQSSRSRVLNHLGNLASLEPRIGDILEPLLHTLSENAKNCEEEINPHQSTALQECSDINVGNCEKEIINPNHSSAPQECNGEEGISPHQSTASQECSYVNADKGEEEIIDPDHSSAPQECNGEEEIINANHSSAPQECNGEEQIINRNLSTVSQECSYVNADKGEEEIIDPDQSKASQEFSDANGDNCVEETINPNQSTALQEYTILNMDNTVLSAVQQPSSSNDYDTSISNSFPSFSSEQVESVVSKLSQLIHNPFPFNPMKLSEQKNRIRLKECLKGPPEDAAESDDVSDGESDGFSDYGSDDDDNYEIIDEDDIEDDVNGENNGDDGEDGDGEEDDGEEEEDEHVDGEDEEGDDEDEDNNNNDGEDGNNNGGNQLDNGSENSETRENVNHRNSNDSRKQTDQDSKTNQNLGDGSDMGVDRVQSPKLKVVDNSDGSKNTDTNQKSFDYSDLEVNCTMSPKLTIVTDDEASVSIVGQKLNVSSDMEIDVISTFKVPKINGIGSNGLEVEEKTNLESATVKEKDCPGQEELRSSDAGMSDKVANIEKTNDINERKSPKSVEGKRHNLDLALAKGEKDTLGSLGKDIQDEKDTNSQRDASCEKTSKSARIYTDEIKSTYAAKDARGKMSTAKEKRRNIPKSVLDVPESIPIRRQSSRLLALGARNKSQQSTSKETTKKNQTRKNVNNSQENEDKRRRANVKIKREISSESASDSEPHYTKRRRICKISYESDDSDCKSVQAAVIKRLKNSSSKNNFEPLESSQIDPKLFGKACSKLPESTWIEVVRQVSKHLNIVS